MVTAVLKAVTVNGVGVVGVAVLTAVVVMAVVALDKLVNVKLNGPPTALLVIFWIARVAALGVLVKVQEIASP